MSKFGYYGRGSSGYQPTSMRGAHPTASYNLTRSIGPRGNTVAPRLTGTITSNQPHRTTQPHLTEYNRSGSIESVCRCANPTSHGDAFTRRDWIYSRHGRPTLSVTGEPLGWEESMHRLLDAAGKDKITKPERMALLHRVFDHNTAEDMLRHWRLATYAEHRVTFELEDNVIWHGRVNPRGLAMKPAKRVGPPVGPGMATVLDRTGTIAEFGRGSRKH
jgi:hypothetical protein